MKFFRWQPGRSEETKNILKFPIWSWLGFDVYLLKFPKGQKVEEHTDKVPEKEHHRFNFTIYGFWRFFKGSNPSYQSAGNYHKFRPDIQPHSAHFLSDCLVLSIGWTKKIKPTNFMSVYQTKLLAVIAITLCVFIFRACSRQKQNHGYENQGIPIHQPKELNRL